MIITLAYFLLCSIISGRLIRLGVVIIYFGKGADTEEVGTHLIQVS